MSYSNDSQSLSHTKWNCKYHLVFAPKYRRQEIYGKLREDIGQILCHLCEVREGEIIKAEAWLDHIYLHLIGNSLFSLSLIHI